MLRIVTIGILVVIISVLVLAGCAGGATTTPNEAVTTPTGDATTPTGDVTTPVAEEWQWPEKLHIVAAGNSGMVKYVSFLIPMEADVGAKIRVVPEAAGEKRAELVKGGTMFMYAVGKSSMKNTIEAVEDYATKDGGPFPARIVWVHASSASAVFVRGDSDIQTIYDIGPGTKWAVWSMTETVMRVPRAILDWIQVSHDDIHWIDSGTSEGSVRAVAEGRADVAWFFPSSAQVYEAAASPHGIRFLDLDSDLDPEGAARFRERGAMYTFGVIPPGSGATPEAVGVWGTVGYKYEVTRAQADDELVYQFAKWMDENFERYRDTHASNQDMSIDNLMESLENTYIPVHEGTRRYLIDRGVWTDAHERRQQQNVAVIDVYIKAWEEAFKLAETKGIRIDPSNEEWIQFWSQYKIDQGIPVLSMHQSLKLDADWVDILGLGE
jgi:uncharacterized protein